MSVFEKMYARKEKREQKIEKLDTILKAAENGEGHQVRDFSASEQKEIDTLRGEIEAMSDEIKLLEHQAEEKKTRAASFAPGRGNSDKPDPKAGARDTIGVFRSLYKKTDVGEATQGRALLSSGSTAILQNPDVSRDVVFAMLANDNLINAGMRVEGIDNYKQTGRISTYPDVEWLTEGSAITADSSLNIDAIKWTFKNIGCLVRVSNNVLADSTPATDRVIMSAIKRAISNEVHRVVWQGASGSNEPDGLDEITGVQTIDASGATFAADYGFVMQGIRDLELTHQDRDKLSVFLHPTTRYHLDNSLDYGQYLEPPKSLDKVKFFTDSIISNTYGDPDTTRAYIGDFSQLVMGVQTGLEIRLVERFSEYNESGFLVIFRVDIQALQPDQSFLRIENIGLA